MGLTELDRSGSGADHAIERVRPPSMSRLWWRIGIGLAVVVVVVIVAGGIGSVNIPPASLVKITLDRVPFIDLEQTWPDSWETILWQIRFPRVVLAALVGGGLAMAGATYQGLFRNPLAAPSLIGVSGGAGLGATIVLVTGVPVYFLGFSILPIAAFAGALMAVSVSYTIAKRPGSLPLTTLILAGVAIASMTGAITSLLMIRSDADVRPLLAWLLGGLSGAGWRDAQIILPYFCVGVIVMTAYGRILNLFQVDEQEAVQLGVNVERTKLVLVVAASMTTAAAVSVGGLIGFVGLISPHAVRLMWGQDHRMLLPMSLIVGAGFLVVADLVARTIVSPTELPVGVVTAFCGGPFFLYLLRRSRSLAT